MEVLTLPESIAQPLARGGVGTLGMLVATDVRSLMKMSRLTTGRIERLTMALRDALERARAGAWIPFPEYSGRLVNARLKARPPRTLDEELGVVLWLAGNPRDGVHSNWNDAPGLLAVRELLAHPDAVRAWCVWSCRR